MSKIEWLQQEIDGLKQAGLYNNIRTLSSPQGAWLVVDGKKVLNFCSNNYLGLANHPKIVEAAKSASDKYGVGPGAVRTIAGTMDLHIELEKKAGCFQRCEGSHYIPERLQRQSGNHPGAGRQGRCDLLRPPEPCLYH